jgi:ABC-type lipopolysaccharide export system ATPase subunit
MLMSRFNLPDLIGGIPVIEVKNLTKRYGDKRGIQNLNFSVPKGEILGLLGPNGAGKSTTMNIITGYKPPTEGSVNIEGYDLLQHPLEAKRRLGYLPEQPPLYPDLTVISYLRFVAELKGVTREKRNAHLAEIMELLVKKNPKIRVVVNAITLETMAEAVSQFKRLGFEDVDIVQIFAARGKAAGSYHMMQGQNPVFIISGEMR